MDSPPELPGVRHEWVSAAGLRMHVALAGPDDAPPVLLLHGWPQHWYAWREVISRLADGYRLIVPDLRGFGWSQAPSTGYEKENLAADVFALLDALGVQRVTWVGHDWGGFVGQLAALRAPERIDRMLGVAIPHLWLPPRISRLAMLLTYQGPISTPWLGPRIADRMVRLILQVGRGGERLSPANVDLYARHIPPHVTVAMYRTFLTRELLPMARGRYRDASLTVPTKLLSGEQDAITRGIASGPVPGQPQLSVERVPGVAHWIPEQRPEAIADWVSAAQPLL